MSETTELLTTLGYSEKAIAYILNRTNIGSFTNPSINVRHQGDCGDMMELSLLIENDVIQDACFQVVGCAGLQSSGSTVTEMIKGKSLAEAELIDTDDILSFSGGIPENKFDCVETARDTLKKAINEYRLVA